MKAREIIKKGQAAKEKAEASITRYKGKIDDIKNKGLGYKARLEAEILKDKKLTQEAKTKLLKTVDATKAEVKREVFTEEDKKTFRELGAVFGYTKPPRRRTAKPRSRRGCAAPRVRSSR